MNKLRTTEEFLNFKIDEEPYHPTFRSLLQVFKKVAVQVRRRTRPLISYNQASIRRRWASTISRTLKHFDTELSNKRITPDQHFLSRLEFSDEKMFQFNNIKRRIWAVRENLPESAITDIPKNSPKQLGFSSISATAKSRVIWIDQSVKVGQTFYKGMLCNYTHPPQKIINPVTGKVEECKQRFFTSIPKEHRDKVFMEKVEVEVEVPVDAAEKTTRAGKKPAGKKPKPKPKMKKIRETKLRYRECLKKVVDTQEWEDEMVKLLTDPATYDSTVFIQDNAPCHVAKSNYTTFREWGLLVLPWPPNSPDLNVIENAWSVMNGKYKERLVPDEVFAPPIEAARGRLSKTMSALDRASHTTKDRVRLLWMQEEIATIVASEAFEASKRWLVVSLRHRVQYLLEYRGTFIKDMGPFRRANNIIKQVYEESQCKDEVFDPSRHTIDDVILNPKMTFTKTVKGKKKTQTLTEAVESKKYLSEFQFGDTRLSTKHSAQPHKKGMTSSELIAHHRQKRIEKNAQAQAAASDAAPSAKDKKNKPEANTPKQKMNKDQQQLFDNIG